MQRFDDAGLLRRRYLGAHSDALQPFRQLLIGHLVEVAAEQDVIGHHANLTADLARDDVVIAGQDLHSDPGARQRSDRGAGTLLWRVKKSDEAQQRQAGFILYLITRPRRGKLVIGDADHAKPVSVEAGGLLLHLEKVAAV